MAEEVLKKFGRYFLLDRIAQGGMAEIYRSRLASAEGAGRLLVIKRIQGGYGGNAEFLEMFKSEIKVTMGFNHPNIVQVYDFGEENKQPYIAMELVDGKNLRQFMNAFRGRSEKMPIELGVHVVEQVAAGLNYAHAFKDKITGAHLNIVHRDISPQNILVSYDGAVKVIDFGIAKATTNSESTRAGVIKGKPSYLSPEQIAGDVLDGRSDIFSLGIVLWEALTGQKLFSAPGENEFAVLKQIESCTTHVKAPSTINPEVPKDLDYIVLKCLAKQREKRYQTAEELQRALHKFLYSGDLDFSPSDLTYIAKNLFKDEIVNDRKKLQELNAKVEELMSTDIPEAPNLGPEDSIALGGQKPEETTTVVNRLGKVDSSGSSMKFDKADLQGSAKIEIDTSGAGAGLPKTGFGQQKTPPPAGGTVVKSRPRSEPPRQRVEPAAKKGMVKPFIAAAAIGLAVIVLGPKLGLFGGGTQAVKTGNFTHSSDAEKNQQRKIAEREVAQDAVADGKTILLRINLTPGWGGVSVSLNGQSVDPSNPAVRVNLDEPLELTAQGNNYKIFRREFVLESRQLSGLKEWLMDVALEPIRYGYLSIHTTPSADAMIRGIDPSTRQVASDGKPWVLKTPIENEKFPIGTYSIRLLNDVLGMEKTVVVKIQEGKSVRLDERLEIK